MYMYMDNKRISLCDRVQQNVFHVDPRAQSNLLRYGAEYRNEVRRLNCMKLKLNARALHSHQEYNV